MKTLKLMIAIAIIGVALLGQTASACTLSWEKEIAHTQMHVLILQEEYEQAPERMKDAIWESMWNVIRREHALMMDYRNAMENVKGHRGLCQIYMRNVLNY